MDSSLSTTSDAAPRRGAGRGRINLRGFAPRRAFPLALLCAAAVAAAGCGAVPRITLSQGNPTMGETLFKANCSACHTLAAAGTSGVVGPNLDYAFGPDRCQGFSPVTIMNVVRGQIAYADTQPDVDWPPGSTTTVPGMPENIVTGAQARDVAAFVATEAGVTHGPGKHFDCSTGAYSG
jgi:mono/diheme cytochrome c family protein